jgi:hypothetical protein
VHRGACRRVATAPDAHAKIDGMERRSSRPDLEALDRLSEHPADEARAVRIARLRRDAALSPAERLAKFEALQREAAALRNARRLP